jgi:serine/threonine-protein kinase
MSDQLERLTAALADRYAIEKQLGAGGMATVYLAEDIKHQRKVAVKVLKPELAAALGHERFLREITTTANLRHPHILPLYDSGEADDFVFYVMPYVEGEPLRDRLDREQRLRLAEALQITRNVADALSYAHTRGVIHRDVKPENILLESGHAVVVDFGIARAVDAAGGDKLTQTGLAIGTPVYMSPEQAWGQDVDGRSDLYSLGCVLYEMLAGEAAFQGPSAMAIFAQKAMGTVPRLRVAPDTVPGRIEHVIGRALASAPAERFATVQQFVEALAPDRDQTSATWSVQPPRIETPVNSVAVLPFVSMSPDALDEYLGDGISEELIHVLARTGALRVVARTSAFAFKGSNLDVRAIGERLNVRRVVEGSVRRTGDKIRVTAQLIDVGDGYQLWSERYDRQVDDLLTIQDEITAAIAATLNDLLSADGAAVSAPPPAPGSRPQQTRGFATYEQYLRGRYYWNMRTESGLWQSVECLKGAVEDDVNFALAHAALADAYVTLGLYGTAAPDEVMPAAKASADRALAIDHALAEALTARACVFAIYEWDWRAAEEHFTRAIAVNPQYPTGHQWYAINHLTPLQRFTAGHQELRRAQVLDPLSLSIAVSFAALSYYEGDFQRTVATSREALRLDEHFAMAHYFLGLALEQQGSYDEAAAALERAAALSASGETQAALAHVLASSGKRDQAERMLKQLVTLSEERYVSPVLLAQVELALGENDRAVARLQEAHERHATDLIWLNVRPTFDPLRDDPRFVAIVDRLGL